VWDLVSGPGVQEGGDGDAHRWQAELPHLHSLNIKTGEVNNMQGADDKLLSEQLVIEMFVGTHWCISV